MRERAAGVGTGDAREIFLGATRLAGLKGPEFVTDVERGFEPRWRRLAEAEQREPDERIEEARKPVGRAAEASSEFGSYGTRFEGGGSVLVADDEELVRRVLKVCLQGHGFSVLTAGDGREAVERFRRRSEQISLVVLDITMPRMGGEEAFREIRRIREDVAVIIASGFSEQDAVERFRHLGVSGFLQKPFRTQELIEKVREVTGGR